MQTSLTHYRFCFPGAYSFFFLHSSSQHIVGAMIFTSTAFCCGWPSALPGQMPLCWARLLAGLAQARCPHTAAWLDSNGDSRDRRAMAGLHYAPWVSAPTTTFQWPVLSSLRGTGSLLNCSPCYAATRLQSSHLARPSPSCRFCLAPQAIPPTRWWGRSCRENFPRAKPRFPKMHHGIHPRGGRKA